MKKIAVIPGILAAAIIISGNVPPEKKTAKKLNAEIYYVDSSMQRLIPVDMDIGCTTQTKAAQKVINKLIEGEDYNRRILRLLPKDKKCMSVKVKENTAYVNLTERFTENIPENKNQEILMLYSIVNSLTSIDGIDTVKFLFDGEERKTYIGGIDMREVFIPDYYV